MATFGPPPSDPKHEEQAQFVCDRLAAGLAAQPGVAKPAITTYNFGAVEPPGQVLDLVVRAIAKSRPDLAVTYDPVVRVLTVSPKPPPNAPGF